MDEQNCGQFTCGRDAHGVNGLPAIGGRAVRETFGCGRNFSLDMALRYEDSNRYNGDENALRILRDDLAIKQQEFEECNASADLWRAAAQFSVPHMSFHVQKETRDELFPSASLLDFIPDRDYQGVKLLDILQQLPTLQHLHYLPDMIEVSTNEYLDLSAVFYHSFYNNF